MKRAMKPSRSRYVASLGQRWRWMAGSAKVTDKQPGSELLPPTTRAIGTDTHSFSNTCNVVCPAWGRPFTESIDWYQNHHLNHSFRGIILRKITVVMNWRATLTVANMSFFEGKVTLVVWEPVRHYLSVTAINFATTTNRLSSQYQTAKLCMAYIRCYHVKGHVQKVQNMYSKGGSLRLSPWKIRTKVFGYRAFSENCTFSLSDTFIAINRLDSYYQHHWIVIG